MFNKIKKYNKMILFDFKIFIYRIKKTKKKTKYEKIKKRNR